ncbi:MAG: DNA-processing protein DprA [Nitriliruptoraceae bacterium]
MNDDRGTQAGRRRQGRGVAAEGQGSDGDLGRDRFAGNLPPQLASDVTADVAATVAADGSDPEAIIRVVAWAIRPRRSPDGLRRACRDSDACDDPFKHVVTLAGAPASDEIAATRQVLTAWQQRGVKVALVGDPLYPQPLAEAFPTTPAPVWVAWRGEAIDKAPSIAIVGARRASGYGTAVAAWLAESVARAGVRVVSGGARGIDAAAHRAALEAPGGTAVVLGCGHAVDYPRPHAAPAGLFDQVVDHGGTLLSECLPFEQPRAGVVRARNRIVAGLVDAVVIVEGGERSGALLTASAAADWGRAVLAVPGDVRAPGSAAPHRLLSEGAAPCTSPDDVLEVLTGLGTHQVAAVSRLTEHDRDRSTRVLADAVWNVLAEAWPRPVRLEDLAVASGVPAARLMALLTQARIAGELSEGHDGIRLRREPADVSPHRCP